MHRLLFYFQMPLPPPTSTWARQHRWQESGMLKMIVLTSFRIPDNMFSSPLRNHASCGFPEDRIRNLLGKLRMKPAELVPSSEPLQLEVLEHSRFQLGLGVGMRA